MSFQHMHMDSHSICTGQEIFIKTQTKVDTLNPMLKGALLQK